MRRTWDKARVTRWTAPCLALALLGCSTQLAYDPAAIEPGDTALIRPARQLARRVFIRSVDGRELGWLRDRVRVAPGPHEILVTVIVTVAGRDATATHELQLDARPRTEYALHAEWAWYGPAAVLRDGRTGVRVASAEPRPPIGAAPR
jgi:hypothetical protein